MMSTLVDSNVLLDVVQSAGIWREWSLERLSEESVSGLLVINAIVYSEASAKFETRASFDMTYPPHWLAREDLPLDAAYLAGKAHAAYRAESRGVRERTLPDFLIGAHALVKGHRLLTRDSRRYRRYFPGLVIIAPDTHP